jgi:Rhodopirellula transposase DDE domain
MQTDDLNQQKYKKILPYLNEKQTRIVLAAEAESMGRGGLSKVSKLTGISRITLNMGIKELALSATVDTLKNERIRKSGGGRKKATEKNKNLAIVLEKIVSPHTMGDPMKPLLWTNKSLRNISDELKNLGYNISHKLVGVILKESGYSLQGNRKTDEGSSHIDRDAQFNYINEIATDFLSSEDPVISVDCKKKELVGNFKNDGKEWLPTGNPTTVKVYDFIDKDLGKAIPYGVYDIGNNEGWVSVGISHDTASFAVSTIRSWWYEMGEEKFSKSNRIFITADGGGSNSSRSRLWKIELQVLADEICKEITVSHFPPGTSKWNKIEHRLFSHITMNWRARPLTNIQLVVDLIASTKTSKGLKVKSKLDLSVYEKGIKISDSELNEINLQRDDFHGEWNYKIIPNIGNVNS